MVRDPEQFTPEEVRASKDTANRVLTMLKAPLNRAYEIKKVKSKAAWERVKPFKLVGETRKVILTDDQMQRLLDKTTGGFHALVKGGQFTGARYGELIKLKVSDFKDGTLHHSGKTGERYCRLSNEGREFFAQQVKGKLPGAWIFTRDDGEPWGKSHQHRSMQAAVKSARLPKGTTFYALRHTYISKACAAGVPLLVMAKNCGSSSVLAGIRVQLAGSV
jgi:integrase